MFKLLSFFFAFIYFTYFTVEGIVRRYFILPVRRKLQRRRWIHELDHGNWDLAMKMLAELNAELDAEQRRSYR